jgi:hypothetical protein
MALFYLYNQQAHCYVQEDAMVWAHADWDVAMAYKASYLQANPTSQVILTTTAPYSGTPIKGCPKQWELDRQ